jgi:transposase
MHKTVLEDICAVIGLTATLRLSAWYGDAVNAVRVPRVAEEGQVLVNLIGLPAAKRLSQEWGGQALRIPRLTLYSDDVRKRIVGLMLELNFSTQETADQLKISQRRVQQICRELERAGVIAPIGPVENAPGKAATKNAPEKPHGKRRGRKRAVLHSNTLADLKSLLQEARQVDRLVTLDKLIQARKR